jgi:hypothetical protein
MQKPPPEDYLLKETKPPLGGALKVAGDKYTSAYDLVEQMQYLYVRVVKAKELPAKDVAGSCDPYAEVKLGKYKGITKLFEKKSNPEWNQVFAFSRDRIQSSVLEVTVKYKDFVNDDFMGWVWFDLNKIAKRVPPDSPLAPQWYRLQDRKRDEVKGELMLAVWMGTQADEAFPEAWNLDTAEVSGIDAVANLSSKVYLSPKLWYLRVSVIEVRDLQKPSDNGRFPEVFVKAIMGNQALSTGISQSEDLMFVVAEPIEEPLVLRVQDRVAGDKDEVLGRCTIPLQYVERRQDNTPVDAEWYTLERNVIVEGEEKKETKVACRIHARICLEGGYHVLDESIHYSSDHRPTAKQLWKTSIGVLELGILNAEGLMWMKTRDGRRTTDAYCVAKYGQQWARTRTIMNSGPSPRWNEQYGWEVFDPCTVITIGVFDNCLFQGRDKYGRAKDLSIGKVRIRLSTLETGRVYTHSYPLLVLNPDGVKKMGEIQLALRFTCSSLFNMMHMYSQPLLPKMHDLHPLTVSEHENFMSLRHEATDQTLRLRHEATQAISMRLSRADPPLRKEVVEYMLDAGSQMWSMRRSKANFFRIMGVLSGLIARGRWFDQICHWKNPIITVVIHILFIILVMYPGFILPAIFLYLLLIGVWNYIRRPRYPSHVDIRLSHLDTVQPDELDEEFDTFPTSRSSAIVRMRYDRLRSIAGRLQTVVGDLATQGERLQSLLTWQDPRATTLSVIFCLVAAIVFCLIPFRVLVILTGFYMLRHPRFRSKLPSVPTNFFRRLPSKIDYML